MVLWLEFSIWMNFVLANQTLFNTLIPNSTWDVAKFTSSLKYRKALRNTLSIARRSPQRGKLTCKLLTMYIITAVYFTALYNPCLEKTQPPVNQQHTCGWLFSCRSEVACCLLLECAGNGNGGNRWHECRLKCVLVPSDYGAHVEFQFNRIL